MLTSSICHAVPPVTGLFLDGIGGARRARRPPRLLRSIASGVGAFEFADRSSEPPRIAYRRFRHRFAVQGITNEGTGFLSKTTRPSQSSAQAERKADLCSALPKRCLRCFHPNR